ALQPWAEAATVACDRGIEPESKPSKLTASVLKNAKTAEARSLTWDLAQRRLKDAHVVFKAAEIHTWKNDCVLAALLPFHYIKSCSVLDVVDNSHSLPSKPQRYDVLPG